MCGRFTLQIDAELLMEIFGLAEPPSFDVLPRFNIAPTQSIPAVRQYDDRRNRIDLLRWGLVPPWTKQAPSGPPLINARSETVADKPAFRHAIKFRRCLIPTSGFYEWQREGEKKIPIYIRLRDGSPMVFAGIWESWKSPEGSPLESCSILTTASNGLISSIHDRMPVILSPADRAAWLNRGLTTPADLEPLYRPYPAELMEMFTISPKVNSARNDSPDLILPVPIQADLYF